MTPGRPVPQGVRWLVGGIVVVLLAALIVGPTSRGLVVGTPSMAAPTSSTVPSVRAVSTVSTVPAVPTNLTMTPSVQIGHVQDPVFVDVRLSDEQGRPVPATAVAFRVVGTNADTAGGCEPADCRTDDDGQVRFHYTGTGLGQDKVTADVTGVPVFGATTLTWAPSIRGSWLAVLGDSYSSGEGTGNYLAGTDIAGQNSCHRSPLAYAELVRTAESPPSLAFRACSGAVTDDLFTPNSAANRLSDGTVEPAQLCVECAELPAAVGVDTQAVALTIGGNDAGFAGVLSSCIWASELNFNYGRPGRGCSGQTSITDPVAARIAALAGTSAQQVLAPNGRPIHSVNEILQRIHALAPDAHIYVLGYPHLFESGGNDCYVGQIDVAYKGRRVSVATKVTPTDARWMDSVADSLNGVARSAATAAGPWASFVDVIPAFGGHGLCTGSPWINRDSGTITVNSTHDVQAAISPGSFHPGSEGQQAYAQALRTAGL